MALWWVGVNKTLNKNIESEILIGLKREILTHFQEMLSFSRIIDGKSDQRKSWDQEFADHIQVVGLTVIIDGSLQSYRFELVITGIRGS